MYAQVLKSIKYRAQYAKLIKIKFFNKIIKKNDFFLFYDVYKINILKNTYSITRIRNRCILNGRARGMHSKFRMSRFYLKTFANSGLLNGIKKK